MASRSQRVHVVTTSRRYKGRTYRTAMRRLGFATLLASRPCPERDLVVAMVAARIVEPEAITV